MTPGRWAWPRLKSSAAGRDHGAMAQASQASDVPYRGRFAPSPTGPLHAGSLLAAFGSWLLARAAGGQWLVRIEDVDRPREVPGAAEAQLATLSAFGLESDLPVVRQSERQGLRSEEHTSELQSRETLVCRILLYKQKSTY